MSKITIKRLYDIAFEEMERQERRKYNTEAFKWLRHEEGDLNMVQQRLARLWKASDIADYILDNLWETGYIDAYDDHPISRTALIAMLNRYRRYLAPVFIEWYRNDIEYEDLMKKLDKKYGYAYSL